MEGKNEESTKLRKLSNRDASNKEKRRRPTILTGEIMKTMTIKEMEESKGRCPMCGALLEMQPGPLVKEGGKTFCNRTHAYDYRLSLEPMEEPLHGV